MMVLTPSSLAAAKIASWSSTASSPMWVVGAARPWVLSPVFRSSKNVVKAKGSTCV